MIWKKKRFQLKKLMFTVISATCLIKDRLNFQKWNLRKSTWHKLSDESGHIETVFHIRASLTVKLSLSLFLGSRNTNIYALLKFVRFTSARCNAIAHDWCKINKILILVGTQMKYKNILVWVYIFIKTVLFGCICIYSSKPTPNVFVFCTNCDQQRCTYIT